MYQANIFQVTITETLNYKIVSLGYETFENYNQAYDFLKSLGSDYVATIDREYKVIFHD